MSIEFLVILPFVVLGIVAFIGGGLYCVIIYAAEFERYIDNKVVAKLDKIKLDIKILNDKIDSILDNQNKRHDRRRFLDNKKP